VAGRASTNVRADALAGRHNGAMRIPLSHGAWLDHQSDWLSRDEADFALVALRDELDWEQREIVILGRRILQPRLVAWAGDLGYRYSGQTLEPRPWTPAARALRDRVCTALGVVFNHVLVNRYRDGTDSMGFHADAEPELGPDPFVAIVSLGAPRRLIVKAKSKQDGTRHDVAMTHGGLLAMGGTIQRHYVHGIPRDAAIGDERISLTFRTLLRAP
jgi:alkylated DNA repair dioxygenase AlkB